MSIAVQLLKEQLMGKLLNKHEVAFLDLLKRHHTEEYLRALDEARNQLMKEGEVQG